MRKNPLAIKQEVFREVGYKLIDAIADHFATIREQPVTYGRSPSQIQQEIGNHSLPDEGRSAAELLSEATELLFNHSLFNGHPKFLGYITSSAAPIGVLAELIAASVNANVGGHILSPVATEIEKQTVQWLAEFIGLGPSCSGLLVSGGNMANLTAFLAATRAKGPENFSSHGFTGTYGEMTVYCSKGTHNWIEKATMVFGLGTQSLRWIPTDSSNRMDVNHLKTCIEKDIKDGHKPIIVVGTAGDVSTGAVDDLEAISKICKTHDLWFHVDGAYGAPAAVVPEIKPLFKGIEEADSVAIDPHKWLYSPLEAGCVLVRDINTLTATFSLNPEYYHFSDIEGEFALNYYTCGLQNSRGFRALKVWLALQQMGKEGYIESIREDIRLTELLYRLADQHPDLEVASHNLSIATFRYVPEGYDNNPDMAYLNTLNESLLESLQGGGEVFPSNAIIEGDFYLRSCIVNFRTSETDIREIIQIVTREGRKMHQKLKGAQ